jgi:hypothetical protein
MAAAEVALRDRTDHRRRDERHVGEEHDRGARGRRQRSDPGAERGVDAAREVGVLDRAAGQIRDLRARELGLASENDDDGIEPLRRARRRRRAGGG